MDDEALEKKSRKKHKTCQQGLAGESLTVKAGVAKSPGELSAARRKVLTTIVERPPRGAVGAMEAPKHPARKPDSAC